MTSFAISIIFAIVASVSWGINSHLMKRAMVGENAMRAIAVRAIFTFPILLIIATILFGSNSLTIYFSEPKLVMLIIFTALLIVLGDGIFMHGLKTFDVNLLLPISSIYPLFTTFLLIITGTESIDRIVILGTAIIVLGVVLVTSGGGIAEFQATALIYGIIAGACWGTSVFLVREILSYDGTDPLSLTGFRALVMGITACIIFSSSKNQKEYQKLRSREESKRSVYYLALSGILGWVIGVTFFFTAVQSIGAAIPTPISSTNPIIATIFGYASGTERIHKIQFAGIVFCVLGTIIVVI